MLRTGASIQGRLTGTDLQIIDQALHPAQADAAGALCHLADEVAGCLFDAVLFKFRCR